MMCVTMYIIHCLVHTKLHMVAMYVRSYDICNFWGDLGLPSCGIKGIALNYINVKSK